MAHQTHHDHRVVNCVSCGQRNRVPDVAGGFPACRACHQPLPWAVDADDTTFEGVVSGRVPVLVDLWATWCGPCRMVSPAVEETGRRLAGRLKTVKVDVDRAPQTAARFGVQAVPTLLLLLDGEEQARQVGAVPVHVLERWAAEHLDRIERDVTLLRR